MRYKYHRYSDDVEVCQVRIDDETYNAICNLSRIDLDIYLEEHLLQDVKDEYGYVCFHDFTQDHLGNHIIEYIHGPYSYYE